MDLKHLSKQHKEQTGGAQKLEGWAQKISKNKNKEQTNEW